MDDLRDICVLTMDRNNGRIVSIPSFVQFSLLLFLEAVVLQQTFRWFSKLKALQPYPAILVEDKERRFPHSLGPLSEEPFFLLIVKERVIKGFFIYILFPH